MNLPNKLTLLRVFMIPVFVAVYLCVPFPFGPLIAAAVYALASATDALDGKIARKRNEITDFGKFLDPLADKILVITALVLLQDRGLVHPVITVIIIARELMVTSVRLIALSSAGAVIAAGVWGKAKTVVQMIATLLLMAEPSLFGRIEYSRNVPLLTGAAPESTALLGTVLLWAATVLTVVSGTEYLVKNRKYLNYKK